MLGASLAANAVLLPTPVVQNATRNEDGTITINWTYDNSVEDCTNFVITFFKKHTATEQENFILAKTGFDNIESTGTMKKHQDKGAIWDIIPDMHGWMSKFPLYMEGALGIDTFNYFAGADNNDIFGGAYFVSPDYDLSKVADPKVHVEADLANEAVSVTGGFAMYTYSTDWWDEKNVDYKSVPGQDFHYDNLSNTNWNTYSEDLVPNEFSNRTRICFYGRGKSALWLDNITVSVNLEPQDIVDYCAASVEVDKDVRSYTFNPADIAPESADDELYAFQIRAIYYDYDSYRDVTTIRHCGNMEEKHEFDYSGINEAITPDSDIRIAANNGNIYISGAEGMTADVYNVAGERVFSGNAANTISLDTKGIYIVKVGKKTAKVVL